MEAREPFEHLEHAGHASHAGGFARRAAMLVAVLAALLAIATLSANRASEETLLAQGQATDAYNEYQANSLKQHIDEDAAAQLRTLATGTPAEAAARARADQLDRAVRKKYAPHKAELLPRAQGLERDRDRAESRHRTFQLSEGSFQIGIVLTSVALLTGAALMLYAGGVLGAVGLVLLVIGYVTG